MIDRRKIIQDEIEKTAEFFYQNKTGCMPVFNQKNLFISKGFNCYSLLNEHNNLIRNCKTITEVILYANTIILYRQKKR